MIGMGNTGVMGLFRKISNHYRKTVRQGERFRFLMIDAMDLNQRLAWREMNQWQQHKFEMAFVKSFREDPIGLTRAFPAFFEFVPEHLKDQVWTGVEDASEMSKGARLEFPRCLPRSLRRPSR
jgi:hypothetical protein